MVFKYRALNKRGKKVKGEIESDNRKEAIIQLKAGGLKVLDLKIKKESKFVLKSREIKSKVNNLGMKYFGGKLKRKQFDSFKEELELMGYDSSDITSIMKGLTPDNFSVDKFKETLELTDIQIEKIKAGRLSNNIANQKAEQDSKLKLSFGVPLDDLVNFTEQLSILLDTDVELVESLETVQKNLKNKKLRSIIDNVIYDLTKGKELSEALKVHDKVFSPLYISMVKVGETTGSELSKALDDMSKFLKMRQRLKREALQAAVYPSFVIGAMFFIILFMNYFMIPRFKELFSSMDFEMPMLTQVIFAISENMGLILFGLVAVIVTMVVLIWKVEYTRDRAKHVIDFLSLKVPVVNKAVITALMYQLSLTMSITLRNGISITESLDLVNNVVGNRYLKKDVGDIYYSLEKGKDLSDAFGDKKYMTDIVKMAVTSGEKSGKLNETLGRISEYYEAELESKLAMIIQFIIPSSIILLALVIAPFIIGVYLPITSMTEQISQIR